MAKENLLLSNLIQTVKESAFYNTNRLQELRFREYAFTASKEFIEALLIVHKNILIQLDSLEQGISSIEGEFEDQIVSVQRYGQILGSLHTILQILEMGGREYVPQGAVVLIRCMMKFFDSKAKFLLIPNYEYNYAYVELIGPLRTTLRDALINPEGSLTFADKFAIFWFPLAHRDNVLLNSLLAHEVGHFVNEEKQIVEKLINKVTIDPSRIQEIATEWLQMKLAAEKKEIKLDDFFGMETAKAQVKREAIVKVSEQLKELVADCIAFCLFGPAYLIALNNYLVTLADIDLLPKGYPSSRMRLSFLIDQFEEMKYFEAPKNDGRSLATRFVTIVEDIKKIMKKIKAPDDDEMSKLVYDAIYSIKDDIQKEVHAIIGPNEYTAEKFYREAFMLVDTINSFVPPAEIGLEQPADPISILNAGILYELILVENMYEMLKNKSMEERLLTRHKLHKLIMKAMELSQIQTIMRETKEKLSD